jgi:hypothetical protein
MQISAVLVKPLAKGFSFHVEDHSAITKQLRTTYLDEFCQNDKLMLSALDKFGPNLVAEDAVNQASTSNKIWKNGRLIGIYKTVLYYKRPNFSTPTPAVIIARSGHSGVGRPYVTAIFGP